MTYLILGILLLTIFAPLAMPWGRSLLIYSVATWFVLWVAFFLQMDRESSQVYDVGIISDGIILAFSIIIFIVVIAVRCFAQFIRFKINAESNHT
jgi:hypothetical protein